MKRITLSLLFLLCLTMGWAQKFTCNITGSTTDPNTKELYLIESGADIRTTSNLITIPVTEDGKFSYILNGNTLLYYELIPANQYEEGSYRPAFFFLENQKVTITFGTNCDKVTVVGSGKETKMMQRCKEEIDAVYNPILDAITPKMDSINNILKSEIKDMGNEQRRAYLEDFYSENSTNPYASAYKQLKKESDDAFINTRIATIKWLDEHPCLYGLADMRLSLSSPKGTSSPTTPYHMSSYKNTYSKQYKDHPYHKSIRNSLSAINLDPGNKYIDYDVCDSDGKTVKLSSLFTGKVIYIDLWASWCGSCRKHAKELIPLYEQYKDKGFQVIAIAREQKEENMRKAIKRDGYPWLCLLELNDKNQIWWKNGVPNAGGGGFLIDDKGTILAVYPDAEETEIFLKSKLDHKFDTTLDLLMSTKWEAQNFPEGVIGYMVITKSEVITTTVIEEKTRTNKLDYYLSDFPDSVYNVRKEGANKTGKYIIQDGGDYVFRWKIEELTPSRLVRRHVTPGFSNTNYTTVYLPIR